MSELSMCAGRGISVSQVLAPYRRCACCGHEFRLSDLTGYAGIQECGEGQLALVLFRCPGPGCATTVADTLQSLLTDGGF